MIKPLNILVVAQTPPPVHGQSVMTQYLLEGQYERIRLHHVRMAFSEDIAEVGAFSWKKLVHLAATIARVVWMRISTGAKILYYPPAGPKRNAFYRDAAILVATRWMFHKTVFHFYAAGTCELYDSLPSWGRLLYRRAYHGADLGIALYRDGLRDPEALKCQRSVVIQCGIPDEATSRLGESNGLAMARSKEERVVTFLAMLSETKGVLIFLEACAEVIRRGIRIKPILVGWAESAEFEKALSKRVAALGLEKVLERHGKTTGPDKHAIYNRTHVFCFPTFYPSEGSPVVLLEAMQFGLPIVATSWRGCNDTVEDGVTGFLVPPQNSVAVADKLEKLLKDDALRTEMAKNARERYEKIYTIEAFRSAMGDALADLGDSR